VGERRLFQPGFGVHQIPAYSVGLVWAVWAFYGVGQFSHGAEAVGQNVVLTGLCKGSRSLQDRGVGIVVFSNFISCRFLSMYIQDLVLK
jgi:hypothetical protein